MKWKLLDALGSAGGACGAGRLRSGRGGTGDEMTLTASLRVYRDGGDLLLRTGCVMEMAVVVEGEENPPVAIDDFGVTPYDQTVSKVTVRSDGSYTFDPEDQHESLPEGQTALLRLFHNRWQRRDS